MTDLYKEAAVGARAKSLLDNDVFQQAMSDVRKAIIAKWEAAPIRDIEGQTQLKLMLKLMNDIESNIRTAAQTGTLAALQIEQEADKQSRLRNLFSFGVRNG